MRYSVKGLFKRYDEVKHAPRTFNFKKERQIEGQTPLIHVFWYELSYRSSIYLEQLSRSVLLPFCMGRTPWTFRTIVTGELSGSHTPRKYAEDLGLSLSNITVPVLYGRYLVVNHFKHLSTRVIYMVFRDHLLRTSQCQFDINFCYGSYSSSISVKVLVLYERHLGSWSYCTEIWILLNINYSKCTAHVNTSR